MFLFRHYIHDNKLIEIKYASKSLCSGIHVIFPYITEYSSKEEIRKKIEELLEYLIKYNLMHPFENEVLITSILILSKTKKFNVISDNLEKFFVLVDKDSLKKEEFIRNRYINITKRAEKEQKIQIINDNKKNIE